MEFNPFSHGVRQQRRGVKNFRNCQVKSIGGEVYPVRSATFVKTTLATCPTLVDQDAKPIVIDELVSSYSTREKTLREAQKQLERFCGSSICAGCVYVGMDSLTQVNIHRREVIETQIAAQQAQIELDGLSAVARQLETGQFS